MPRFGRHILKASAGGAVTAVFWTIVVFALVPFMLAALLVAAHDRVELWASRDHDEDGDEEKRAKPRWWREDQ